MRDRRGGRGLEPDGTIDAAKDPVVAAALGLLGLGVGGYLADVDFEEVLAVEFHEWGDVVAELGEAALVDRSGGGAVHGHGRVGHGTVKHQADTPVLPRCGDGEAYAIAAVLIRLVRFLPVVVAAETLQFPLRRHGNCRRFARAASAGHGELPRHGIRRTVTGEILALGLLGAHDRQRGRGQQDESEEGRAERKTDHGKRGTKGATRPGQPTAGRRRIEEESLRTVDRVAVRSGGI